MKLFKYSLSLAGVFFAVSIIPGIICVLFGVDFVLASSGISLAVVCLLKGKIAKKIFGPNTTHHSSPQVAKFLIILSLIVGAIRAFTYYLSGSIYGHETFREILFKYSLLPVIVASFFWAIILGIVTYIRGRQAKHQITPVDNETNDAEKDEQATLNTVTKDENKVNLLSLELGKREHAKDREFSIVEIEGDLDQCDIPLFKEKHSKVYTALQKSLIENNMKVEWLQSAVRHPAFQDIAFQYNGNVFSILIGFVHKDNWKTKVCVYQDKFRRQLRECKEHGLIPCILPFDFDKEEFIFEPLEVISSKTDKIIDFLSYECNSESIWSEWEYYNFGVNFAEYYLESKGYKIINCSNLLGIDPCINAEFQGQQIYLIVNTFNRQTPITYGVCRNMFSAYQNRKGYYLELRVSERNLNKEIRHGAPLDLEVKGMIPIEDAIDRSTSTNRSPEYIYLRWNEKNQ
jgi:hypothetical protein